MVGGCIRRKRDIKLEVGATKVKREEKRWQWKWKKCKWWWLE